MEIIRGLAKTSEAALHSGQRAHLVINRWRIDAPTSNHIVVGCDILNIGRSVARNQVFVYVLDVVHPGVWPPIPDFSNAVTEWPYDIQPDQAVKWDSHQADTNDNVWQEFQKGDARICFWCVVRYKDIFDKVHENGLGLWYDLTGAQFKVIPPTPGTRGYNYAD